MQESTVRSVVKAISWRVVAALVTFLVVWVFTGKLIISLGSTITVALINTIAYFVHERMWNVISWGRRIS